MGFVRYDTGFYPCEYIDWQMRRAKDMTQQQCELTVSEYERECCSDNKKPKCGEGSLIGTVQDLLPIYKDRQGTGATFAGPATCTYWTSQLCDHDELFNEYCHDSYCSKCVLRRRRTRIFPGMYR